VLLLFAAEVITAALPKLRNLDPITKKRQPCIMLFQTQIDQPVYPQTCLLLEQAEFEPTHRDALCQVVSSLRHVQGVRGLVGLACHLCPASACQIPTGGKQGNQKLSNDHLEQHVKQRDTADNSSDLLN
jgi:hypothetical protein